MTIDEYRRLRAAIVERGFSADIEWAEGIRPCDDALDFFVEYLHVVVNSGMKFEIAAQIFQRVKDALLSGRPVSSAFGHPGKARAIQDVWENQDRYFAAYLAADDKLAWLQTMPWIGAITKFHLGRNLGLDVCKPDRHLTRIAGRYGTTPDRMCARLSRESGDRIGTVDTVLWRAAIEKLL